MFFKSLEILKQYLKTYKQIPSEKTWNKIAVESNCLSSKTIQYISGFKFNKLCRNLIKETNKENKYK